MKYYSVPIFLLLWTPTVIEATIISIKDLGKIN
jgi:hypothetical protein